MGLPGFDRARVLRKVPRRDILGAVVVVDGGVVYDEAPSQWFRCFFNQGTEAETRTPGQVGYQRTGAELLCKPRDLDGNPVDLHAEDQVEIKSRRWGHLIMEVNGTPERLAKRRTIIGFRATLTESRREPEQSPALADPTQDPLVDPPVTVPPL